MVRLSPRQKLISKMAAAAIGGAAVVAGCGYTKNNLTTYLQQPKTSLVQSIDFMVVGWDPGAYMDAASGYLLENPEEFSEYKENLSGFVYAASEADLFSEDLEVYLFSDNALNVPVDAGIRICEDDIFSRANQQEKLEHLVRDIEATDVGDYTTLLKKMVEGVGQELYLQIRDLFD